MSLVSLALARILLIFENTIIVDVSHLVIMNFLADKLQNRGQREICFID
jgi:hypothetical protein